MDQVGKRSMNVIKIQHDINLCFDLICNVSSFSIDNRNKLKKLKLRFN